MLPHNKVIDLMVAAMDNAKYGTRIHAERLLKGQRVEYPAQGRGLAVARALGWNPAESRESSDVVHELDYEFDGASRTKLTAQIRTRITHETMRGLVVKALNSPNKKAVLVGGAIEVQITSTERGKERKAEAG